jgi:ribonucleotide monophosphatase NagD (HAD superfamily)
VFVTNNSTKSRKQYGKKFESLGLDVTEEEIFASSFAAAAYLKSINFPSDKKVYVVGEAGIQLELKQAGISYIGGPVLPSPLLVLTYLCYLSTVPKYCASSIHLSRPFKLSFHLLWRLCQEECQI